MSEYLGSEYDKIRLEVNKRLERVREISMEMTGAPMDIKEWLDFSGWLHLKKHPHIYQCENKVMFTALLSLFEDVNPNLIEVWAGGDFRRNWYREWNSSFSHDEMTGLYCLVNKMYPNRLKHLPTSYWCGRWWLHPRDLAFYFYVKNRFLGSLFLWIPIIAMFLSCIKKYKYRNGVQFRATDGKLLTYLRCKAFGLNRTFAICTWLLSKNKIFGTWNNVAKIYFKEEGHPLRSLIK